MYIKHKDANLFIKVIGEGEPLVFLHGNGENHSIFLEQIKKFKKDYRLILIDTRLHGKSKATLRKYTIKELAEDVMYILKKLKINSSIFVGFSDGANILFEVALLDPLIVKKAIAISGNLTPKGIKSYVRIFLKMQSLCFAITNNKLKKLHYHLMLKEPQIKFSSLNKVTTPFLIVAGSNDLIKDSHTKQIHKNLLNSKIKIIPNADHFAIVKKPQKINEIIEDYLKNDN